MANDKLVLAGQVIGEDRRMPDNAQYQFRFQIQSASSDRLYTIAQNKSGLWWACSCPGWIRHKDCKHLRTLGLPGHHTPRVLTPGNKA